MATKILQGKDIRLNALYSYKGITCRVRARIFPDSFLVNHHKVFDAFVKSRDLKKIDSKTLKLYLLEAKEGMGK